MIPDDDDYWASRQEGPSGEEGPPEEENDLRREEGPPHDEWIPVSSSNVAEVMYESLTAHLHVRFHQGGGYYMGVPEYVFEEFVSAPSKGKFVHQVLKGSYFWVRGG